jgi:TonB family protein
VESSSAAGKLPKKGAASAAVSAAGPCAGECAGNSTPALEGQLAGLGRTARRCYDQALTNNPELKGRIMVSVRVGSSGQVCSAKIASNGTGDAALGACVAQKYQGAQLPAPQKGCVDVQVPLNFVPDNAR